MAQNPLKQKLARVLLRAPSTVAAAYLFGSQARGDAAAASDIDLAVLLTGSDRGVLLGPLSRLSGLLERELGKAVDLVDLRAAPPDLVHRILRDGELVLDRVPDERVAFEVRSRNEYFDLLPHLERYRTYRTA